MSFSENARDEGGCSKFVLLETPRGKAGQGAGVADASPIAEAGREVRRREAASATRRSATRSPQWSTRPDPSQETEREETAVGMDHAQLLPEFDAVYVWKPRDRVIVKRMITYLARERQNVFVEEEKSETNMSSLGRN